VRSAIDEEAKVTSVPVEDLRLNGGTQPRALIDEDVVAEYAEAMERGDKFPPMVVFYDGTDHWLADGFHRVSAARQIGRTFVQCDVRQGTWRDAILFSVGANSAHGLKRTNADKRRAVKRLLDDEEWARWSDREIARACRVNHELVGSMRPATGGNASERTYLTKHGTEATMRTENIGRGGGGFGSRNDPEDVEPQSEEDAKRVALIERHRPIIHAVEGMIATVAHLPSPQDALREMPKALRLMIDAKKVRDVASWLVEFADGLR
jgi:hypothetical protein